MTTMAKLPIYEESVHEQALSQYRRALGIWSGHVADETCFASAGVYANAKLRDVPEANCLIGDVGEASAAARGVGANAWLPTASSTAVTMFVKSALRRRRLTFASSYMGRSPLSL